MELFKASSQWSTRPDDERFPDLPTMHTACTAYRTTAAESRTPYATIEAIPLNGDVAIQGKGGIPSKVTHWAFGQLCARAEAPGSYLRQLPPTLAATCLNHGLQTHKNGDTALLMFHKDNGNLLLRAATSLEYTRIWNSDITSRLVELLPDGWRVPPARPARASQSGTRPATEADVLGASTFGLSIKVGDLIAPAGLYASDHDMFAFLVNETRQVSDGVGGQLSRGFFAWNSEVGAASFGICSFLYRHVCGNHIVWDASKVVEVRLRHVGSADRKAFRTLQVELRRYADRAASDDEALITQARTFEIAGTKDQVLDRIFRLRVPVLSKARIEAAYDRTDRNYPIDGSPRTAWGMAQGLTRISQETPYADTRTELDRAAGKVLAIAF